MARAEAGAEQIPLPAQAAEAGAQILPLLPLQVPAGEEAAQTLLPPMLPPAAL